MTMIDDDVYGAVVVGCRWRLRKERRWALTR